MRLQERTQERILLLLMIGLSVLMLMRAFFGIEFTDEAYYVAEAKGVLEGNIPYAFNSSRAIGMTFLMLPFYTVYKWLVPDLTGVFLYMRICYVVFRMAIIVLILWLLRKQYTRKVRLLAGLVLVVWFGSGIQNFSYNTIAMYLLILTGVLLATALEGGETKTVYRTAALAGVLMAFTTMAHIAMAIGVLLYALLIWRFSVRERRWKTLGCYILGGMATALIVLGIVGALAGFDHLFYGLESFLFYNVKLPSTYDYTFLRVLLLLFRGYAGLWIGMALVYGIVSATWRFWEKFINKPLDMKRKILIAAMMSILAGSGCVLIVYPAQFVLRAIGALAMCGGIACVYFRPGKVFWFTVLPCIFVTLLLSFSTSSSSPTSRFSFLAPTLFVVLLVLGARAARRPERVLLYGVTLVSILAFLKYDFLYTYRDANLQELTTRVEDGIFAGIYTTPQRAADAVELEDYLRSVTESGEKVMFRDNAPVAYLMHDGVMCDVRTWDHLQYSYGCNDPVPMYRYFLNRHQIPDKIIYVDLDINEQLSIEDPDYQFNEFVNAFYCFEDEKRIGQNYRVKLYQLQDGKDTDVFSWLKIAITN